MPTLITDFTSLAEVRAVLGVSVEEIADTTLALDVYLQSLVAELDDVADTLVADFLIVKAVVEPRSDAEQKFYAAVKLFAPYCVGNQLASALPLFSPKSLTDGKAGFSRYSDSPYKRAIEECRDSYTRYLARLVARYAIYKGSTSNPVFRTFLYVASPSVDPVVG